MSVDPPETFESYIASRNLVGARVCAVLGALLMPAGVTLDWITHPSSVRTFFVIRLMASAVCLFVVWLTYLPWTKRLVVALGAAPALTCAIAIEVFVELLEGYASPYYAGLNLCILGVGVIYTWTVRQTSIVCALIVAVWIVPTLMHLPNIEWGPAFNSLYFLSLTSVIAVASNASRYRLARSEYDARMAVIATTTELALTLSRLKELDRVKNEFFANISHELRTPLTLILAPVDDLLDSADAAQATKLEVVRRNAERLLRLIDDLLDLARLEAGGLRLNVRVVDLRKLANQVVESFRPSAAAKSIAISAAGPTALANIFGDPHRLEMVLTNLVGNAFKFTPIGGRIEVNVAQQLEGASVTVTDTGPGIASADLPRIFERFYQVESSARRRYGGAGIGLALAKELTALHGGKLTVESEVGRGSSFKLWLRPGKAHFRPEVLERRRASVDGHEARRRVGDQSPGLPTVEPTPTPPRGPAPAMIPLLFDDARRPRILVAEDQEELRNFMRQVMEQEFDIITARDGEEALVLIRKERPDLVISDVMMPGMAGTDLCQAIKQDPQLCNTPVILLTARVGSDAALEGYAHGADDFVTKPFHTRLLIARVQAQLKLRALSLHVASQARLAAVGTLAAGVAHEVRNPLNAIVNAAQVMLDMKDGEAVPRKLLEVIAEGSKRIEVITSALDAHVRPGDGADPTPCDVRAGIDATLQLLDHRSGGVSIERTYETDRKVLAPAGELNQVFMNLLDNALRSGPKSIRIQVVERSNSVIVRVTDDGPGISAEVAQHIFDPFFTTRPPGEGTGLGLYLSRRMIRKYGGELKLERPGGGGAEFAIELPAEV